MQAIDSYFIGGISGFVGSWIEATNTRTNYTGTNVPTTGAWIIDQTLNQNNPEIPLHPDSTYLESIWRLPQ